MLSSRVFAIHELAAATGGLFNGIVRILMSEALEKNDTLTVFVAAECVDVITRHKEMDARGIVKIVGCNYAAARNLVHATHGGFVPSRVENEIIATGEYVRLGRHLEAVIDALAPRAATVFGNIYGPKGFGCVGTFAGCCHYDYAITFGCGLDTINEAR
jgi:hypothetical protein